MRSKPCLAALLAAALSCTPALADDVAEQEARLLFEQGNQHIEDGDYNGALTLFKSAHARHASVNILLNIGTTLRQLGRSAEAADVYEEYLRDPAAAPSKKAEVERLLANLEARVGRLRVEVDDPKATVRIDGKMVGQSGISKRVAPGSHAVSAEREEGPLAFVIATAVMGRETRVELHIVSPPAPLVAQKPAGRPEAPPATPALSRATWPDERRIGAYAAGAVGLAGLVLGGIMGGLTLAKKGAIEENCNIGGVPNLCNHTGKVAADDARTTGLVSTIGFGAGIAGLGVATVLLLTEPRRKPAVGGGWMNGGVLTVEKTGVMLGVGGAW